MTVSITSLDQLYPPGAFFCGRTTREVMRWNVANVEALPAYRLDATPAQLAGFAGNLPFVAHEASVTPEARQFADLCGLPGAQALHTYRSAEEAAAIAASLMDAGRKLVCNFGTLPDLDARPDDHLVPPELLARLNAKNELVALTCLGQLAPHALIPAGVTGLPASCTVTPPLFIKVGEGHSTGGGGGVFHCPDNETVAMTLATLANRLDAGEPLRVEADCDVVASWCAGVSVLDGGVQWLGASRQMFSSPGRQSGNVMTAGDVPLMVREVAMQIAGKAGAHGFRGVAGVDIGERPDGSVVVFDLNCRPNASTGLLLGFETARQRTGLPMALAFYLRHDGPLANMLDAVSADAQAGRIIPGSMFDRDTYRATIQDPATRSCLDGWVLAEDRLAAENWINAVRSRLA